VVAFHISSRVGAPFTIGAAGVDIFFVISGFVMWVISASHDTPPHRFMANRLRRIIPLYWIATIGLATLAALTPTHLPSVKPSLDHALLSLLFIPHYNADGRIWPLLVPGWTLNYEMFFYALFTIALLFSPRRRLILLSTVMVALVLAGKSWAFHNPVAATWTGQLSLEFLAERGSAGPGARRCCRAG
jgi:exopolysaccharide production protein ExoZ